MVGGEIVVMLLDLSRLCLTTYALTTYAPPLFDNFSRGLLSMSTSMDRIGF